MIFRAFSPSYDLAPPPFPSVSSTANRQEDRERETTCREESGGEEPNHTTARMSGPRYHPILSDPIPGPLRRASCGFCLFMFGVDTPSRPPAWKRATAPRDVVEKFPFPISCIHLFTNIQHWIYVNSIYSKVFNISLPLF
jgi:hypothetical protein